MDLKRLHIALLFIIVLLSNIIAIAIELFEMMGELYIAPGSKDEAGVYLHGIHTIFINPDTAKILGDRFYL
jgi:hypothetical protein